MLERLTGWMFGETGADRSAERMGGSTLSMSPGITVHNPDAERAPRQAQVFIRLWLGFLVGRVLMAVFLLAVPWVVAARGSLSQAYILGAVVYLALTMVQRWQVGSTRRQVQFSQRLVGVCAFLDVLAIVLIHHSDFRVANYYLLLAMPLLYVSILGTRVQAMAMASALTLLLLGSVWWAGGEDFSTQYIDAAGKGLGAMIGAWVIHYLATRLDEANHQAEASRAAAELQVRVNELVMEEMAYGVLVLNDRGQILFANPSACDLLGVRDVQSRWHEHAGLRPLHALVEQSFVDQTGLMAGVELGVSTETGRRRLSVTTRLTSSRHVGEAEGGMVCVLFMEDSAQEEMRIRQEKMAAMGRMSAAVAHEIRNPLAAIVQANALLQEEVQDAAATRMIQIVEQNARRIARTVEDVLDASRLARSSEDRQPRICLQDEVSRICADWTRLQVPKVRVLEQAQDAPVWVRFDAEHLRRLLVNLLDNARQHAPACDALVVECARQVPPDGARAILRVFNPGPVLAPEVADRMFEPFFSSQARSSGLGLYICRQLCENWGATIAFRHLARLGPDGNWVQGNQFEVTFEWPQGPSEQSMEQS